MKNDKVLNIDSDYKFSENNSLSKIIDILSVGIIRLEIKKNKISPSIIPEDITVAYNPHNKSETIQGKFLRNDWIKDNG